MDKSKILDYKPVDTFGDVKEFFDLAQKELQQKGNQKPDSKVLELGIFLINQEVNEELIPDLTRLLQGPFSRETTARVLDSIIDSIYVLCWTAIALDLPFNSAWKEVQKANMNKFPIHDACKGRGCDLSAKDVDTIYDGKLISVNISCIEGRLVSRNSATGKVIKPGSWKEPNIFNILNEHWNAQETDEISPPSRGV